MLMLPLMFIYFSPIDAFAAAMPFSRCHTLPCLHATLFRRHTPCRYGVAAAPPLIHDYICHTRIRYATLPRQSATEALCRASIRWLRAAASMLHYFRLFYYVTLSITRDEIALSICYAHSCRRCRRYFQRWSPRRLRALPMLPAIYYAMLLRFTLMLLPCYDATPYKRYDGRAAIRAAARDY